MPNLYKKYETDRKKEVDGVDITVEGVTFICRRAGGGNRAFRAAIALGTLAPGMQDRLNSKDSAVQLEAEAEVTQVAFSEAVVIGWRDVLDRDDEPLEFNPHNFLDLVRSCPDVWDRLRLEARDVDNFRLEQVKNLGADLGNSSAGVDATESTSNDTKL